MSDCPSNHTCETRDEDKVNRNVKQGSHPSRTQVDGLYMRLKRDRTRAVHGCVMSDGVKDRGRDLDVIRILATRVLEHMPVIRRP